MDSVDNTTNQKTGTRRAYSLGGTTGGDAGGGPTSGVAVGAAEANPFRRACGNGTAAQGASNSCRLRAEQDTKLPAGMHTGAPARIRESIT